MTVPPETPAFAIEIVSNDFRIWPIATDDASTANRRFRGIADMDRFFIAQ
jgi:hypothetical protein